MKKFLALTLALVMSLSLVACGDKKTDDTKTDAPDQTEQPAENEGAYKVAMITDYGDITDQSFNQTTYEACKAFAEDNSIEFSYFKPAGDNTADRVAMIEKAVDEGFNVIVMPGYAFGGAIVEAAPEFPDVKFIALDVAAGDLLETAVAKAGVRLLFVKVIELYAHFGTCFAEAVLETEVKQVVLQGAAQQKLHAQVVDLLCLLLFSFVYKFVAAANEQVAHHKCGCFVEFIVGSVLCGNAVNVRELLTDCALDLRGGHLVIHSLSSMCYA